MAYIEKHKLMSRIETEALRWGEEYNLSQIMGDIEDFPEADVVEVETIKAWLYEMAINNVGYVIEGDFSVACEEIISRLDGLRMFAKERKLQKEA